MYESSILKWLDLVDDGGSGFTCGGSIASTQGSQFAVEELGLGGRVDANPIALAEQVVNFIGND